MFSNVLQLTTVNNIPVSVLRTSIFGFSALPGTWGSTIPITRLYQWQVRPFGSDWFNFTTPTTATYAYLSAYETGADVRVIEYAINGTLDTTTQIQSVTSTSTIVSYTGISDIPNLQLWLDASDASTVTAQPLFTDWCWYFDGTGDYLSTPNIYNFDTNNFTIEFWVCIPDTINRLEIFSNEQSGSRSINCYLSNKQLWFAAYQTNTNFGPDVVLIKSDIACQPNEWTHFAITRNGNIFTVFVNGIGKSATGSGSIRFDPNNLFRIGYRHTGNLFKGYMSNFRLCIGSSLPLYTSDFSSSLPTAPLPLDVPDTVLQVLTRNSTLQDYSSNNSAINIYGNVTGINDLISTWKDKSPNQLSATQSVLNNKPTYALSEVNGRNAVLFDGTDDYLNLSQSIAISNDKWSHFFVYRRSANGTKSISIGNGNVNEESNAFLHYHGNNVIYSGSKRTQTAVLSLGVNIGAVSKNVSLYLNNSKLPYTDNWGSGTNANTLGRYYGSDYHNNAICEVIHANILMPDYELNLISNELIYKWTDASSAPAPTPTRTQTQTPTGTPTNTPTPTGTPTNTPTLTQTPTQTYTSTQTPTITQTQTPTRTQTPTLTQTPAPLGPPGLVLSYDTTDLTSYSGTGSTINNIFNVVGIGAGTIVNSPSYSSVTKSFTWNSTSYVRTGNLYPSLASNQPLTIEVWAYPTNNNCVLVSVGDTTTENGGSWHASLMEIIGGKLSCRVYNGPRVLGTTTVTLNVWHQFVLSYNGTALSAYLDGQLQGTAAGSSHTLPGSVYMYIGATEATSYVYTARFTGRWGAMTVYSNGKPSNFILDSYNNNVSKYV